MKTITQSNVTDAVKNSFERIEDDGTPIFA